MHVRRERIGAQLTDAVATTPVTLVSAPTGYGKSTLLSSWATSSQDSRSGRPPHGPEPRPVIAWLTLDELDDTVPTLWQGIVGSLTSAIRGTDPAAVLPAQSAPPGSSGSPRQSRTAQPDGAAAVDELLSDLDELDLPVVLVLDNVDLIRSSAPRAMLDRLVSYAPTSLRIVLAGRFDPPLSLHRLRTAGALTELRHQDLRFSESDVHQLAELSHVRLTPQDYQDMHRATAGWPVAVKMALVSLAQDHPAQALAPLLSPTSPAADLLVTTMLDSLGPELSTFVLRATTCRTIDAQLADTLNGGSDGARLLAECIARGLFLDRLATGPEEPTAYRWHDFFAAQCQAKLASSAPETWRALNRSAAQFWQQRNLDEAVTHALRGGRPALAARFIQDRWIELVLRGEQAALLGLCRRIPAPLDDTPAMLLLSAVCQYLDGNPTAADLTLRRAHSREQASAADPSAARSPESERFALLELLLRVVLSQDAPDLTTMARYGHELLTTTTTDHDPVAAAGAEYIVGQLLARAGHDLAAHDLLDAAAAVAISRDMAALRLACEAEQALLVSRSSGSGAGRSAGRSVLTRAQSQGWEASATVSPAYLALARSEYERDDLGSARTAATQCLDLARSGDEALRAQARALLLEVALADGSPAGAEELHDLLLAGLGGPALPKTWAVVVAVLDARWHLALGDLRSACAAVTTLVDSPDDMALLTEVPGSAIWAADVLRRSGDLGRARRLLDATRSATRADHDLVSHDVVAALLAADSGDVSLAHPLLESALRTAEKDDLRRPFADRARELRPVLGAHLGWGTAHTSFCVALLEHLPAEQETPQIPSFWSLTTREHEVLLYLRTAMTAADIASAVFVSVNTVKTHQRAIYRKLGVEGRRDAVRVANERGLL